MGELCYGAESFILNFEFMKKTPTPEEKHWAMACHLAAFTSLFLFPAGLVVSLILWLVKKDESLFIRNHGAEAINFQISVYLYLFAILVLFFCSFLVSASSESLGVLIMFLFTAGLPAVIFLFFYGVIRGAIKASHGEEYLYPFCIRLIQPRV